MHTFLITPPTPEMVEREKSLQALMAKSKAWFDALSPEDQEAHLRAQRESWVRGEMKLSALERETTVVK